MKQTQEEAHRYWKNPDDFEYVDATFRGYCQPEYYLTLSEVSDFWLNIFKKYVDKKSSIVELGCSVGRNINTLFDNGYKDIKGIEINERAVQIAKEHYGEKIASLIKTSKQTEVIKKCLRV